MSGRVGRRREATVARYDALTTSARIVAGSSQDRRRYDAAEPTLRRHGRRCSAEGGHGSISLRTRRLRTLNSDLNPLSSKQSPSYLLSATAILELLFAIHDVRVDVRTSTWSVPLWPTPTSASQRHRVTRRQC